MFVNPLSDDAVTLAEAARLSRVCRQTVARWIKDGELAAGRIGGRWYTTAAALEDFARRSTPAQAATYPSRDECDDILKGGRL